MTPIPFEEVQLLHNYICQSVNDPKRIQILYALGEQPMHVTALAELLNMPQPTVSRHLSLLRQRLLVTAERSGPAVVYRLTDPRILDVLDQMRSILREMVGRQAGALDSQPESR
ncbi:MAG: winged helix-turn-helix transcriptional regulator [Chloroflexota bacterium]|jgi:ArsR family transcriptional regulator